MKPIFLMISVLCLTQSVMADDHYIVAQPLKGNPSTLTTFQYNPNNKHDLSQLGKPVKKFSINLSDNLKSIGLNGLPIFSYNKDKLTRNSKNQIVKRQTYSLDGHNKTHPNHYYDYIYNNKGQIKRINQYSNNGKMNKYHTYQYTKSDQLTSVYTFKNDQKTWGIQLNYDNDLLLEKIESSYHLKYVNDKQPTTHEEAYTAYKYDKHNNLIEVTKQDVSGITRHKYYFNEDNLLQRENVSLFINSNCFGRRKAQTCPNDFYKRFTAEYIKEKVKLKPIFSVDYINYDEHNNPTLTLIEVFNKHTKTPFIVNRISYSYP